MINNIIFDFDGVIVDSEILAGKAFSRYLSGKNFQFSEMEFSESYSGNKLIDVISKLSSRFNIKNKEVFFNEVMELSHSIYMNEITTVSGIEEFLTSIKQNTLIGSNRQKNSIIEGLKLVNLDKYFKEKNIFSYDMVKKPKPDPGVYLKAIEDSKIDPNETIIIEDSIIGVQAGVSANIKVIGITAGKHWKNRPKEILLEVGAYNVFSSFKEMLKALENYE